MKPRATKPNPWMLLNRARKVGRIVLAIEELVPPEHVPRSELPGVVERWDDAQWRRVAVFAGQNPPSDDAKADVLEMLRERAKGAA